MSNSRKAKTTEEIQAERERYAARKNLEGRYKQRFTIAKEGKAAFNRRDFRMMIYRYSEYLQIMADTFEVPSIYELKPSFFDEKKDLAELLIISQIYWELAKVYDGSKKSRENLELCLKQFVRFTVGMQFQGLNSEVIRKELKRKKFHNKDLFLKSLEGIYKEASGCYIATYFEADKHTLSTLRHFKNKTLNAHALGQKCIFYYYELSPDLIEFFKRYPTLERRLHKPVQYILKTIAQFLSFLGYGP